MVETRQRKKQATKTQSSKPPLTPSGKKRAGATTPGFAAGKPAYADSEEGDSDDISEDEEAIKPPPSPLRKGDSVSSNTSKSRNRLDHNIEKQLLVDIESNGGIFFLTSDNRQALSRLLKNPERARLFGEKSGDPIRKKISRRVCYLKTLKKSDYDLLLASYNIEPAKLSARQLKDLRERERAKTPKNIRLNRSATNSNEESDFEDLYASESESEQQQPPPEYFSPTKVFKPDLVRNSAVKPKRAPEAEAAPLSAAKRAAPEATLQEPEPVKPAATKPAPIPIMSTSSTCICVS